VALAQTVEKHIADAQRMQEAGNAQWWKLHEATMLALGSTQEVIERQMQHMANFDLTSYLQSIVLNNLANPASPFLFGRCLWIGSKFPAYLPDGALPQFLEAIVQGLQQEQLTTVRISAVRALRGFCDHLKRRGGGQYRGLLNPVLPAALDALVRMSTAFSQSSDILGLVLENLAVVLACDPAFTAANESKVTPLAIAIFLKYNSDPMLVTLIQDVLRVVSQTEGCLQPLQARLVPTLVSILDAQEDKVALGLKAVALDVLEILVRGSQPADFVQHLREEHKQRRARQKCDGRAESGQNSAQQVASVPSVQLSQLLVNSAFPSAVRCTLASDDNAVMQSGGECLRAYVSVAPEQLCTFADAEGKTGLWYLVRVAEHLLNPVGDEFSATFVGRLVTTLIQRTGDKLGAELEILLKAVLSKLSGTKTLSVVQSLLMVFAHLAHNQMAALLNFLSSLPGPNGEPALEFVLSKWVDRHNVFYGAYENKVSIVALSEILQRGVNTNDSRLQGINVAGDMVRHCVSPYLEYYAFPFRSSIPMSRSE